MSGPLAMNLLSWRTLTRNPKRKRPQGKIYPYHYGIYVRIQYRIRRRNGTTVHADVANQCPNEETTNDPDLEDRQQDSQSIPQPEVKEPDPPPRDYAREFDEMTAKSNWNIPNLMNDVEQLNFETYYGLTKTAAWKLLDGLCCPAQLFRYEKGLMGTNL